MVVLPGQCEDLCRAVKAAWPHAEIQRMGRSSFGFQEGRARLDKALVKDDGDVDHGTLYCRASAALFLYLQREYDVMPHDGSMRLNTLQSDTTMVMLSNTCVEALGLMGSSRTKSHANEKQNAPSLFRCVWLLSCMDGCMHASEINLWRAAAPHVHSQMVLGQRCVIPM